MAADSEPQPWQVAFNKVRTQTTAGVAAVRRPATLLVAIEATLHPSSQGSATTTAATTGAIPPAAYLAALVSTLTQLAADAEAAKETGEKRQLLEATLYLLSILLPHVEPCTLRPQLMTIVPTLAPLFTSFTAHAPAVKSLLAIGQVGLSILSTLVLEKDLNVRTTYAAILSLCEDPRPKVRRRAQEAVQELLKKPPPPSTVHPYATESANWILNKLQHAVKGAKRGGKKEGNAPAGVVGQGQKKAQQVAKAVGGTEQDASAGASDESRAIALLTFVRNLGNAWSDEATPSLLPILLSTLTLSSQHLTLAALTLLSHLFSASRSAESLSSNSVQETLLALLDAKPRGGSGETNEKLLAGWVEGVGEGLVAYARTNPDEAQTRAVETLKEVLPILSTAQSPALRTATEAACEMVVRHCLLDKDVLAAVEIVSKMGTNTDVEPKGMQEGQATLVVVQVIEKAITSPRFAAAAQPHVLALAKALFLRLRVRIPSPSKSAHADPAASILLRKTLFLLSKLREDSHFEWKRALEDVLDAAIKVCGPESVLAVLPLGLEEGANPAKAKAWLLPLLKPAITNTRLEHFKTTFVPLSAELFAKAEKAKEAQKGMEAKVWETLVGQVWALLPGYCEYPTDLVEQVDAEFLGLVANVVYAQPMLRPAVFKALSTLVGTTKTLAQSNSPSDLLYAQFGLTPEEGKKALKHLQVLAETVLGISFNVYGKMARGEGGFILTTVGDWLAVLPKQDLVATFDRVAGLLKQALDAQPKFTGTNKQSQNGELSVISPLHALLDILITMIPYAGAFEGRFFDLARGDSLLKSDDAAVQKKAYRILARLAEERGGQVLKGRVGEVLEGLVEGKSGVAQGAKRDRVLLLSTLVPLLPSDSLHHIPSLIPEAVLGTKESNERTREAAYELVVGMATKMQQGGTLARHKVKGMRDDDEAEGDEAGEGMEEDDVPATVEEFVTMLSAGLAGISPHMISATITSLSRVLFEFHAQVPDATLQQVVETLVVFLSSPNREIVRSALGFIKVCLVVLDGSLLEPSLPQLVPNLINWSHEHSNHFKVKVRHLLERLMRKFGHEKVERYAPEEDRKLVGNLRKKMMRSKKKKAAAAEARGEDEDMSDVEAAPRANPRSAYDEVLYGSDSDASGLSDNEQNPSPADPQLTAPSGVKNRKSQMRKQKQRDEGTFIHEDEDEVLDLLDDRMMSNISAGKGKALKKERKDLERHFKTDETSGRMKFDEEGEREREGEGEVRMRNQEGEMGGALTASSMGAYLEAMRGEDGHTLDAKGKAKFNKTQGKRARSGEFDDDDVQMDDATGAGAKRKKKGGASSRETVRVGQEFKAKRAGGDVKKNGMEPYAFVPLQAVAGKKAKGGPKIGLTGLKRAGGGGGGKRS